MLRFRVQNYEGVLRKREAHVKIVQQNKNQRDCNSAALARDSYREQGLTRSGTPEEDQNDLILVFEIEFIGQLFNDYKSVDLKIWRTFTDTTLYELLDGQDNEKHSLVV